jgi:hypothetical protein
MAQIKTQPTDADVTAFLEAVPDERRRAEGFAMLELMQRVTKRPPVMWGPSMVGFGSMHYRGKSSEGEWYVVGFSPRKAALTLYGLQHSYGPPEPLLDDLGPHTLGMGCIYVKKLEAVDHGVLERLVKQAWDNAAATS